MSAIPTAVLGRTGATVTKLAYGAMELRRPLPGETRRQVTEDEAGAILGAVLDAGITLIDTSPDYDRSEELIGRFLAHRRGEFFLASKCGCAIDPPEGAHPPHVFTRANVRAGVEQSLRRMRTDHLDLVQFHLSPSRAELEAEDSVAELVKLREEGKLRFIGISTVLPNMTDHIPMGVFDAFQVPYSALERQHEAALAAAAAAGVGVIVRGGVAQGIATADAERLASAPGRLKEIRAKRRDLWEEAKIDEIIDGMGRMEFMLRFTLSHPGMTTTIVGTANPAHLAQNVAAAAKGPLPADMVAEAKKRLDETAAAMAVG